jgi:DNA-binding CsgD family transcriptional regulator
MDAYGFTRREREVAALILVGKRNREIAETLSISEITVKNHVTGAFRRAKVNSRAQLVSCLLGVLHGPA